MSQYDPEFKIGSEDEDGSHRRDHGGWPYSIYREAIEIGATDMVLCHGIQHLDDARHLLALANGTVRPPIMSSTQMFAWR
jgi:hypothetical protein